MTSDGSTTRRGVLAGAAALVGAVVARQATSAEPVAAPARPSVPPDASAVLGTPSTALSERSVFEQHRALAPTGVLTGPSYSPLHELYGTITPTDLQFQRHHAGIAHIDPSTWRLLVHGAVERELLFTFEDIQRFPAVNRIAFLECSGNGRAAYRAPTPELTCQQIDGLTYNVEWTGVPLKLILREAGLRPDATWMLAEGGDASRLSRSVPIEKALDDALLVYAANGEPLRAANGYPMRLLLPGWEGNLCIKWLRRLELRDQPSMTRDETSKYTDPLPGGRARQFSWVLDVKSIITHPSYPKRLSGPGWWPISGLAWSGRGRVTRVEVSTDDGATWQDAEFMGPSLPMAHVRFQLPWRWEGQEAVLLSRATDETGAVQPTVAEFVEKRGAGTDYHFNAIRAWRVAPDGSVFFRPDPAAPT
jgi:sulfane dehydrogenase subunit SoxC